MASSTTQHRCAAAGEWGTTAPPAGQEAIDPARSVAGRRAPVPYLVLLAMLGAVMLFELEVLWWPAASLLQAPPPARCGVINDRGWTLEFTGPGADDECQARGAKAGQCSSTAAPAGRKVCEAHLQRGPVIAIYDRSGALTAAACESFTWPEYALSQPRQ